MLLSAIARAGFSLQLKSAGSFAGLYLAGRGVKLDDDNRIGVLPVGTELPSPPATLTRF